MPYGETPVAEHVSKSAHQAIMHGCVEIGEFMLMGSDGTPEHPYEGVKGASVAVHLSDPQQAERIFAALSEGGQVTMPMMETFWAKKFGMVTDRFGIAWMVNCAPVAE